MVKLLLLPARLLWSVNLTAHPGHGEVASMTGTVMAVDGARIPLDTLDRGSDQRKVVWIVADDKTKYPGWPASWADWRASGGGLDRRGGL